MLERTGKTPTEENHQALDRFTTKREKFGAFRLALLGLVIGATVGVTVPTTAAVVTWNGDGDATSWSDLNNWDLDLVPNLGDDVVIDFGSVDTDGDRSANTIQLGALASLTIDDSFTLASSGSVAAGAILDLTSTLSSLVLNGNLTVEGTLGWGAGTISGPGQVLLTGTARLDDSIRTSILEDTTFINQGVFELSGATFRINGTAMFENLGLLDIQGNFAISFSGSPGTLVNRAVLQKSDGTGTATVSVSYEHDASALLVAQSGQLRIAPTGTAIVTMEGGNFDASTGAELALSFGPYAVSGTLSGDPAGELFLDSGSVVDIDATGATFDFGGTGIDWRGGTINIPSGVTLRNADLMLLTDNTSKTVSGGRLANEGNLLGIGGAFVLASDAELDNTGLLELQDGRDLTGSGSPGMLINRGVLQSIGATTSAITVDTENRSGGVIDVIEGTLRYNGALNNDPGGVIMGTGTIDVLSATVVNEGIFAPGGSIGTLNHAGTYDQLESTATLEVELAGLVAGTEHDVLDIGGLGMMGGRLHIQLEANYAPNPGDSFTIAHCDAGCSGDFAVINSPSGADFTAAVNTNDVTIQATDVFGFTAAGTCPSAIDIDLSGATPSGTVVIARASTLGSFTVPVGACSGVVLDLGSPQVQATVSADAGGNFNLGPLTLSPELCGIFLQAVDVTTCEVSTVGQIPLAP